MWVRYEGPGELSFEYNARRFFFRRETPPMDIPHEVYDYVKSSKTVESGWLRPCDAPKVSGEMVVSDYEGLLEQQNIKIQELRVENKKLSDKIEQLQKEIKANEKKKK